MKVEYMLLLERGERQNAKKQKHYTPKLATVVICDVQRRVSGDLERRRRTRETALGIGMRLGSSGAVRGINWGGVRLAPCSRWAARGVLVRLNGTCEFLAEMGIRLGRFCSAPARASPRPRGEGPRRRWMVFGRPNPLS
jgi:hypothetical protein